MSVTQCHNNVIVTMSLNLTLVAVLMSLWTSYFPSKKVPKYCRSEVKSNHGASKARKSHPKGTEGMLIRGAKQTAAIFLEVSTRGQWRSQHHIKGGTKFTVC